MLKILAAMILTLTLAFTPLGAFVFQDDVQTVEAKKYKSGKKSFQQDNNTGVQKNNTQNADKQTTTNASKTSTSASKGGLMKGLMFGGIAGLMLGGLLAGLGDFGAILGLLINALAIFVLISFAVKIYQKLKKKRKDEEVNTWRN